MIEHEEPNADIEIRRFEVSDDRDDYLGLAERAFGPGAGSEQAWARTQPIVADGRCLGAFADGRLVGSALYHDMRQWWCGRAVPMAGVAGVKVAPERRGSGIGHALVAALLAQIAARGYPLSALYPATARLYRPLGWELAGGNYLAVVPARSLQRFTPPQTTDDEAALRPRTVHVRRATADDADTVLSVLGAAHRSARDCGPLTRDAGTVARWLADPSLYAYLAPDGFLAYRWHGGNGEILVERAVAASAGTTRALWLIVASHASVAGTVRARVGPQDPFWWLTAEPDADVARRGMWMLRVVDAPAAVAARGFPLGAELAVRLRIHDRQRPGNDGRWRLSLAGGAGTLVPSHDVGDALALSARGFAALYAGTPVAALRRAGLAASGDPDADAAVDAAFAGAAYMLDSF